MPLPLDNGPGRNNLQAMGSTLSYGKRYCTEMLLNIVREGADDDGETGGAEFITPQQASSIRVELEEVGGDVEKFLAMLKAPTFQDIRKADYGKAMNAIAAKRRRDRETSHEGACGGAGVGRVAQAAPRDTDGKRLRPDHHPG
jgi:hypothetical protein